MACGRQAAALNLNLNLNLACPLVTVDLRNAGTRKNSPAVQRRLDRCGRWKAVWRTISHQKPTSRAQISRWWRTTRCGLAKRQTVIRVAYSRPRILMKDAHGGPFVSRRKPTRGYFGARFFAAFFATARFCGLVLARGALLSCIRLPVSASRNQRAATSKSSVQNSLAVFVTGCKVAISLAVLPGRSQRPTAPNPQRDRTPNCNPKKTAGGVPAEDLLARLKTTPALP